MKYFHAILLALIGELPDNVSMLSGRRQRAAHTYLYLVENAREGGRVRRRIIRVLGRKDVLLVSGELYRLAASLVRHRDRAVMLSDMEAGRIACRAGRYCSGGCGSGSALPRFWASYCGTAILSLPSRSCEKWMADYQIVGIDGLQLHHFYRAMARLGKETAPRSAPAVCVGLGLAPRCTKDLIEERTVRAPP